MRIKGKDIDPIALWGQYCDIKPEPGPFLSLTFCPNPDHSNSRSPAFQININKPFVHCFSHCGVSGTYEHAICVIEGIYDKHGVTEEDIQNARKKWELGEADFIKKARSKVRTAHSAARKVIFQQSGSLSRINKGRPNENAYKGGVGNKIRSSGRPIKASKIIKPEIEVVTEDTLLNYTYLPKEALAYLDKRGINSASRQRWQIGFDEEAQRLTIPVRDRRGRLSFIIRRGIHSWQKPAYLYPPESPKSLLLFGACNLDESMVRSQGMILVEGSIDTIMQHQRGYQNTVGILGSNVSEAQIKLIIRERPKRIYDFFDKDAAGVRAMQSTAPLKSKYPVFVVLYPKGDNLDPAKLSDQQVEVALRKAVPMARVDAKIKKAKRKEALVR